MMEITVANAAVFKPGETIIATRFDTRWWLRLWRWITFRSPPMVRNFYKIKSIDNNTLTVSEDNEKEME